MNGVQTTFYHSDRPLSTLKINHAGFVYPDLFTSMANFISIFNHGYSAENTEEVIQEVPQS